MRTSVLQEEIQKQSVNRSICERQGGGTRLLSVLQLQSHRQFGTSSYFEFDILDLLTSVHYSGLSSALEGPSSRKSCIGRVFSNLLLRRGVGAGLDEGRLLDGHFFHSPES